MSNPIATLADTTYAGWPLIEIQGVGPDGRTCMCPRGANCKSAGKHPKVNEWQDAPRVDVADMLTKRPRANLGVRTGEPAGFWVLDIDDSGLDAMAAFRAEHGPLPTTRVHQTGGGTYHYFFTMPDFPVTNRRGLLPKGIDVRGTGGQVVLPPSTSGKGEYRVVRDAEIVPAPEWLLALIRPTMGDLGEDAVNTARAIEADQRVADTAQAVAAFDGSKSDDTVVVLTPEQHAAMVATPIARNEPHQRTMREANLEKSIVEGETARLKALRDAATPDGEGYDGEPWDDTVYRVACQMFKLANAHWSSLTPEEVEVIIMAEAPRDAGFDDARVKEKIASAKGKTADERHEGPTKQSNTAWFDEIPSNVVIDASTPPEPEAPTAIRREFNDVGNAQRLVDWHGGEIRWAADAETWVAYNGKHWDDLTAATVVQRLCIDTVEKAMAHETDLYSDVPDEFTAKGDPKSSPRQRFVEWMGKTKFETRLKAMANVARPDAAIETRMGDFDTQHHLLNTQNCVVDLRTGATLAHEPGLFLKDITSVGFNPAAKAPMFEAFLEQVHPSADMRAYLQTVAGYSITGETSEQAMFLHNGHGANGKSVFLEIIGEVLGGMAQKMARDTLMSKNGQAAGVPSDVAAMMGARLLAASETAAGKKLDDERIKELVGGERQRARHLFGKWFDFKPTGKIHLATNHLPVMESGGHGMGRRLRVVPWTVTIPDEQQDKMLKEKIIANEAEGVLAWLVRGAMQWYATGLVTPTFVRERTEEHIDDADPITPFIREKLIVDGVAETRFTDIYSAYTLWAQGNGVKPMSGKALSQGLVERLGHTVKFLNAPGRQSCFHVRVKLEAVRDEHAAFFEGRHA